jgi:hypothetical protein
MNNVKVAIGYLALLGWIAAVGCWYVKLYMGI